EMRKQRAEQEQQALSAASAATTSEIQTTLIPELPKPVPVEVPKETEKRGQKLYNALYKRVGRGIDENEFKEWSQYLSNMKRNLKIGEATLSQFEEFLDYSDKLYEAVKIASKNKTTYSPTEKPYGKNGKKKAPEKEKNDEPVSLISSENVDVKPFKPQTFDSLSDAVAAFEDGGENAQKKKPVEVKAPTWEHLSREDAYGKNNDKGDN
ncbi:MAG: hypothetical protein K2J76_05025, partial [Oscillospiraceae bacterium]|nr:hypothetical protein [Oscillospiraceae bacterium]